MPSITAVRGLRRAELITTAPEAAAGFHQELLDWTLLPTESGFNCWVGNRCSAAIRSPRGDEHTGWRLVFAGGELDSSLTGPDDTGAGLTKGRAQHGPWAPEPRVGEPCWIELCTAETTRADEFWAEALSWTTGAAGSRAAYDADGRNVASRVEPGVDRGHKGWLCYFAVADIDAAAAVVPELGGEVTTRFEHDVLGTAAVISDQHGATCALVTKPEGWGG